jgi:hypothetical protein
MESVNQEQIFAEKVKYTVPEGKIYLAEQSKFSGKTF